MTADLQAQAYETGAVLYMALELSNERWRLAFGDGSRRRQVGIAAGAIGELLEQIGKVKAKWGMPADTRVVSCYEAGRDGFWLRRQLAELGIDNRVVDAASIEVSRRARRARTDRLDAQALLEKLIRYEGGERRVWRVVRVPDPDWEELRQLHREREQLLRERTRHRNRLRGKLVAQGLRVAVGKGFLQRLEEVARRRRAVQPRPRGPIRLPRPKAGALPNTPRRRPDIRRHGGSVLRRCSWTLCRM